jgi:hypothetical protein
MKNTLISEVRADKTGKLVTRHVRADKGAVGAGKPLPSPSLPAAPEGRKKRAFKPNEAQLASGRYGIPVNQPDPKNWGPHVIGWPNPDLAAIPFTKRQQETFVHDWYRFDATDVEYYSVMSVVRPFDALNLLHRGIKSADEARKFLDENGLTHLAGDYSAYTDELLRHRINSNLGMVYMNDIIDAEPEPALAGEWVKMCSQKSIMDAARFIKDEMLSGQVTMEDLKAIGVRNLGHDIKTVAQYIIHSKNDNNPNFTLKEIGMVMEDVTRDIAFEKERWKANHRWGSDEFVSDNDTVPARLAVVRALGEAGTLVISINTDIYDWELKRMEESGKVDPVRLGRLTFFASKARTSLFREDEYLAMAELFDSGVEVEKVRAFLDRAPSSMSMVERLREAKAGLHTSVVSGWL